MSESLLQCNELFRNLRLRKCDRRAFGVNGEPVVTLGIVDIEFKIAGLTFTHPFTVLRGLIHPMLLGMDFLTKHKAKIDLGESPGIQLSHHRGQTACAPLIKSNQKAKPFTHIALVEDITIPPMHSYYANAYIAKIDCIKPLIEEKAERLIGITSVQKIDESFDPGFIMRDAVVSTENEVFKVELLNPSEYPLKIAEDTPIGAIFDYDCEIVETNGEEQQLWEEKPSSQEEEMYRKQALLAASIRVVDTEEPERPHGSDGEPQKEWKMKPPDEGGKDESTAVVAATSDDNQTHAETSPSIQPQTSTPSYTQVFNDQCREKPPIHPEAGAPLPAPDPRGHQHHGHPSDPSSLGPSLTGSGNQSHQHQGVPSFHLEGLKPTANPNQHQHHGQVKAFVMAVSDESGELKYSDIHGKDAAKDEKTFMVDMDGAEYEGGQREHLVSILEADKEAFTRGELETGCTNVIVHHVKIPNPKPVYISYKRAQGPEIRKEVDNQTDSFLASGVIKESESPYCSPIVMVRKKYGGWRYCVDLRRINQMTEKVTFPMPRIEDALRKFKKPKYFSTMDLYKAYYQVPVAEEDQKYYAFSDGKRHLQFTRCPMGAKNSGSTLAMLMELVLRGLPPECVIGYLDDILLATEDWETHMVLLDKLLKSLIRAKLKLCPSKCQFGRKEVKALGFRLTAEGIRPDRYNLDKLTQWTMCKNVSEVRTFLGLTGYYRSLIQRYAHIAAPLSDLTHDGAEWKWGDREIEAFNTLKEALTNEPIAAYPDFNTEFLLKTDASGVALGAVLAQNQEKRERMIAAMSKKFTKDELKWCPYDREFLAMIIPVRHFSHYLRWSPFKLFTDHKPLLAWKDVTAQKDATGKRTRWTMELSTYDVEVIYKEGKKHGDADALSRHPQPDDRTEDESEREVLSTVEAEMGQLVPEMDAPSLDEMVLMLSDESQRVQKMAMDLSKYRVSVIYRETGKNQNVPEACATNVENGSAICSLTTEEELELDFVAAEALDEVALVEIHADEELGKEMADLQDKDQDIGKVKTMLRQNVKDEAEWRSVPNWYRQNRDHLALSNNVLYHSKKLESFTEPVARTVIPGAKIKEMLFRCHGCIQSGHPGHQRAKARLEKFAVWRGMGRDVENHIQRCPECQAARANVPKKVAPIQVQRAMAPLQFVQADLFKTGIEHKGFNYVCVIEDRFTKFAKFYALKDTKAKGVALCMETFVTQFGCPEVWGTDGGPEFYNALVLAMCNLFKVKKTFSLAHRPQTNGQIERKNRNLKSELAKRIYQFGKDWPSYLKWIELAYNSTPHPSHGFTPFLLMHGREARLPMQHDIPKIDTTGWQSTMKSYLPDFLERMAIYRKQMLINRASYQMKMANQHDKNVLEPLLPGTQVLRMVPSQFRSKLDLPKDGPWEVEEQRVKHGRVLPVYKIRNEEDKVILSHRESLSKFEESETAEKLITKTQEEVVKPKEKKKGKREIAVDGPASRTRSRRAQICLLGKDRIDEGNDDGGDENNDNGDGDHDGDGGNGGGDGDAGDDDDDQGGNEGGDEANHSDVGLDAEQFAALPGDPSEEEPAEEDANRVAEGNEENIVKIERMSDGELDEDEAELSANAPTDHDDEDRSRDQFNDARLASEFTTPGGSPDVSQSHGDSGSEREENRGYQTANSDDEPAIATGEGPEDETSRVLRNLLPIASPVIREEMLLNFTTPTSPQAGIRSLVPDIASPDGNPLNPPNSPADVPGPDGEITDDESPVEETGYVVEMVTNKDGVATAVRRGVRQRKKTDG